MPPRARLEKDDPQAVPAGSASQSRLQGRHRLVVAERGDPARPEKRRGHFAPIRWAKEAGIPAVFAGDGHKPDDLSEADALKLLGDRLAPILEVADACGVYLAIEPHGTFSLTADGLRKIMALSGSKRLAVNYDTANVHRATYVETVAGEYSWKPFGKPQDKVATLKAVIDRVVHVHVKNVVAAKCVAPAKVPSTSPAASTS